MSFVTSVHVDHAFSGTEAKINWPVIGSMPSRSISNKFSAVLRIVYTYVASIHDKIQFAVEVECDQPQLDFIFVCKLEFYFFRLSDRWQTHDNSSQYQCNSLFQTKHI